MQVPEQVLDSCFVQLKRVGPPVGQLVWPSEADKVKNEDAVSGWNQFRDQFVEGVRPKIETRVIQFRHGAVGAGGQRVHLTSVRSRVQIPDSTRESKLSCGLKLNQCQQIGLFSKFSKTICYKRSPNILWLFAF